MRHHVVAGILLSIILLYLLDTATQDVALEGSALAGLQEEEYDYFMAEVDRVHYGADGQADYRVQTRRLVHYPNPAHSAIEAPRFVIYQQGEEPWVITSDAGRIEKAADSRQDRLELSGNVLARQVNGEGEALSIYTDFLIVHPQDGSMATDRQVRFESSGGSHSAVGMTYDLTQGHLAFLDGVESRYE